MNKIETNIFNLLNYAYKNTYLIINKNNEKHFELKYFNIFDIPDEIINEPIYEKAFVLDFNSGSLMFYVSGVDEQENRIRHDIRIIGMEEDIASNLITRITANIRRDMELKEIANKSKLFTCKVNREINNILESGSI